jgi:PAS domain S-box-containing protein
MTPALRVLLIDDNPDDRQLVMRELRQEFPGLRVEQANDAESFARALQAGEFDLVITDYQLRWTNGLATLQSVKARHPRLPVIMFTATGSEEIAVEVMKAGLDDYVLKSTKHFARLRAAVRLSLERARDRQALREAETRYRSLFENVPVGVFRMTLDNRVLDANPAMVRMLGFPDREALMAGGASGAFADARARDEMNATVERQGGVNDFEARITRPDGSVILIKITSRAMRDAGGRILYHEGIVEDVTERKRVEETLEKLASFPLSNPNAVLGFAADGTLTFYNAAARDMAASLGRERPEEILPPETRRIVHECLATGANRLGLETAIEERTIAWSFIPMAASQMVIGYAFDITQSLHREAQVRQSQKMEAVGQLAGGVAHDFNNLLTVITGYCELLLGRMRDGNRHRREVREIRKAALQAASLTRQLLAYSRRQVMRPKILDLNDIVAEMNKMLRRLIGEDVELRIVLGEGLGSVLADPGQIEQVIMNLAVNARDAMPKGGRLTIETKNAALDDEFVREHIGACAGPHVMLAVGDTGLGMDESTLSRIFEPFFTTKEQGKGTGMGLATVYGIVRQSGGTIWVDSVVGRGTTFTVYLPRAEGAAETIARMPAQNRLPTGEETILLVEDEEIVRSLVRRTLEAMGYSVLEASGGKQAQSLSTRHKGPIHLMLTDVVMPKVGGRALAEQLAPLRPDMKVLYMSGYTANAIVHHGVLDERIPFIQKPFTPEALACKIREVLDGADPGDAGASIRGHLGPVSAN